MEELVTLRTFGQSIDFEMAKSYLESFDIECFGQDEFINRAYFSNVAGGIKLQVRTSQVEEATKLLLETGYLTNEDLEPSSELKMVGKILKWFGVK